MIYIYLETDNPKEDGIETNEYNFIKILIEKTAGKKIDEDFKIIGLGGYKKFEKQSNLLKAHDEDEAKNFLIFDADTEMTDGGFEKRKEFLLEIKERLSLDFELFLYPNNQDDGIFENLLELIVNPNHKRVIEYFKEYEDKLNSCKDESGDNPYEVPDQKARMYSYISAFKRSNRQRELFKNHKNWDFNNSEYWSLNSEELTPLINFIKSMF